MKLYNLKDHNEQVSFAQAIKQGLGKQQGLFFPLDLPEFALTEIDHLLEQDFVTRSSRILSALKYRKRRCISAWRRRLNSRRRLRQ
jgi:threonine synthase